MKSFALAAVGALAVLTVSGCSGGSDAPSAAPSSAVDTASSTAPGIVSPKLPKAPVFTNHNRADGVIADVTVGPCTKDPGPVTAEGTFKNTAKITRDAVITINWAVPSGGDVVARGIAVVRDVAPGKTADWSTKATLASDVSVQCVATARAGQLVN